MEQQIRFTTTNDGVRIAYATVGDGPPLVKAANWLSHLEFDWRSPVWRHWLETLSVGHRLVRYDERGCGLSDWDVADFSFQAWVRDLEDLVDSLGLQRFPLLGISHGGPVAVAYAVRHPEKVSHLLLYGTFARGWAKRGQVPALEEREALLTLTKQGWGKDNPAYRQIFTTLFMPGATLEQMRWFNDLQRVSTSPDNAVKFQVETSKIDVLELLPRVGVPTLVMHCRDDAVVPFEEGRRLAALIPNASFVPLDGKNHLPQEGDPCWEPLIAEVRRFLGVAVAVPDAEHSPPTFMFTDIVKSTNLVEAIGDAAWEELLRWHDRTLRSLFASHGGEEIDHAGDGFFVSFEAAPQAVQCAQAIQRTLADHRRDHGFSPQVRIGLHTARARRGERTYRGKGVHEAARIAALAAPGEILASQDTLAAVGTRFGTSDPRTVTLKGLSAPLQVATINWR